MDRRILFCGRMVIPHPNTSPILRGALLVQAGRIIAVDSYESLRSAVSETEIIDFHDLVMIPGLVDAHNHLSLDSRLPNYLERMNDSECELTLRAVQTLELDIRSGVTTSRCMGDRFFIDVHLKRAIQEGRFIGPRLVVATRGMRASHGHGFVGLPCDGVDALRKMIRENVKAGADLIKFYATGTIQDKPVIPCFYSAEEVRVIVEEASRGGLPTAVHCIGGPGLDLCLTTGVNTIEHGYYITDEQIEALSKSTSRIVLTPSEFLADKSTLSPERAALFRRDREKVWERLSTVVKSGLFYAVGTDGMHGHLADEARYIVEAGASNRESLLAVTLNGAKVCGLDREVGSLEVGKFADIVVIEGNPLEEITALSKVRAVVKEGNILFREVPV